MRIGFRRLHGYSAVLAMAIGGGLLAALFLLLSARPPVTRAAPSQACDMITQYHTRTVQIWYGSLWQGSTVLTDVVELTDYLSQGLAGAVRNFYTDGRVTDTIQTWVDDTLTDHQWVLGESENRNAEQNLRARFTSMAASLTYDPAIRRSDGVYIMASWETSEDAPECPNGVRVTVHEGYARVEYHELNAQVVLATAAPTATPSVTPTTTPTATPTATSPFRAYLPLLVR